MDCKICPTCGKEVFRKTRKGDKLSKYCSKECHPSFGIKRANHSATMKIRAKEGRLLGLMKKGRLHNPAVNSDSFKEKCMETAHWSIDETLSIKENFKKYNSARNKSPHYRRRQIGSIPNKLAQDLKEIALGILKGKDLEDDGVVQSVFPLLWGLRTINYARTSTKGGGRSFKGSWVKDLKLNSSGVTAVFTRSSYETNFINFFEKEKQRWSYESIMIRSIDRLHHYIPDFYIERDGVKYIIEVKGSLFFNGPDYVQNKLLAGFRYARERGMRFVLTFESSPKNWDFLAKDEIQEGFFC